MYQLFQRVQDSSAWNADELKAMMSFAKLFKGKSFDFTTLNNVTRRVTLM